MRLSATFEGNTIGTQPAGTATTARAPKRQKDTGQATTSAAARNLALAHHIERLIEAGVITDYTHAARMLGVSQPRMSQLMNLILLASSIQEAILLGKLKPRDKELRALARIAEWETQEETIRVTQASQQATAQRPNGPTAQRPNGPTAQRPNGPTRYDRKLGWSQLNTSG